MPHGNNNGADQPAHSSRLISAIVVHRNYYTCYVQNFKTRASEAEQGSLNHTWSQALKDKFSRDVAHIPVSYAHWSANQHRQ